VAEYDELEAPDVIALLPSLRRDDLEVLRRHESARRARGDVLSAIDRLLAPSRSGDAP